MGFQRCREKSDPITAMMTKMNINSEQSSPETTHPSSSPAADASKYWSSKNGYAMNWYVFCRSYINCRTTGDPEQFPTLWALNQAFSQLPSAHLLEIGCLSGKKLVSFIESGLGLKGTGVDVAAGAIQSGRQSCGDKVDLQVMDLNQPSLPPLTYSACLANGVLHHIDNLEICCQAIYDALEPGGVLIASEFTGPRRYHYSKKEIDLINQGISMLPKELQGEFFDPIQLAPKLAADPSESVRTRDIPAVIAATFDRVVTKPYGGNILMRALTSQFFSNFDEQNPEHVQAIKILIEFDEEVSRVEPSHHCFFIAYKRS
jgi:SAM-dependent methyltransferase